MRLDSMYNLVNLFHDTFAGLYGSNPHFASAVTLGVAFAYYYLREVVKKPELYCNDNKFRRFLVNHIKQLQEKYWPTVWCFGTHGQTALANIIRGTIPNLKYKREVLQMADGGEVSLDWFDEQRIETDQFAENGKHRPIAMFFPGLTGDSQTEYIKSIIPVAHSLGYRAVAFNNRGRGGMKIKTPRLYCATNIDDMNEVLLHIKGKYPHARLIAIGISLGGIVLSHYLIRKGEDAQVDAAMLISVCYNFMSGYESLERQGLNLVLNRHLVRTLIAVVQGQRDQLQHLKHIDLDQVTKAKTLKEFDTLFTCKMWGYTDADHYYRDAQIAGKLYRIRKPTLCINAADDMFQPHHSLPIDEFQHQSSCCALIVTQKGGHIGFMEGIVPMLPFFSERLIHQYLQALRDHDNLADLVSCN